MRKLLSIFMSIIMLVSFTTPSMAMTESMTLLAKNDLKVTLLEESDNYQKVEIKNEETGKTEYVESFLQEDGTYTYKATSDDKSYTIQNDSGEVSIVDNDTNDVTTFKVEGNLDFNDLKMDECSNTDSLNDTENYSADWCVPDTDWSVYSAGSSSKSIYATDASLVISIIASIVGGPITGIIVSIASWYVSRNLDEVYYHYVTKSRKHDGWIEQKTHYVFYEDEAHRKTVDVVDTDIQKIRFVGTPCN